MTVLPTLRNLVSQTLRTSTLLLIGVAVLTLTTVSPASAQQVYTAGSGSQFGTINVTTGAFAPIGTGFSTFNGTNTVLSGVAYAANGSLYGLDYSARLFQINRTSGVLSLVGTVTPLVGGSGDFSIGNTANGTLYVFYAANTTTGPNIYSINPATAAATLLGSSGATYFDGGIGGDGSGNLFATGGGAGSQTFKLSTTNGAATQLQATTAATGTYALGFTNANLYGFASGGGIYTINTTTGAATNTGVTYNTATAGTSQGVAPLLFVPTVPEPGTVALLALGGAGVAVMGARRRGRK